ncbi:hypothetical protein, partial [Xanthomonas perforans]|uniref:hypothetical protein n=1 Tax=Xanthomonas perforans TaxID=442694 RepID=UPI001F1D0147
LQRKFDAWSVSGLKWTWDCIAFLWRAVLGKRWRSFLLCAGKPSLSLMIMRVFWEALSTRNLGHDFK